MRGLLALLLGLCHSAVTQPLPSSTEVDPGSTSVGPWSGISSLRGAWLPVNSSYTVYGNASLEVDVLVSGFAQSYLNNGTGAATGSTRFNVSLTVASTVGAAVPALVAHVHASRCTAVPPGGSHYLYNASGLDDAMVDTGSLTPAYGTNTLSVVLSATRSARSTVQPWLVDYDRALSVVLHDTAGRIACANLVPTLPNLPDAYSVTIEANFGLSKAYTLVVKEYSNGTHRTVMMHSNMSSQVQVQDATANMTYTLTQNTTYPNGVCVATRCVPNPFEPCNGQLVGLETYYSIGAGNPVGFDGLNVLNVRGISCERWSRKISLDIPGSGISPATNATAYFYFPVSGWSNLGESYHRLLKRIQLNGTSAALGTFSHSYDFFDMIPSVLNQDVFNPCLVLHMGPSGVPFSSLVTGCGCEKYRLAVRGGGAHLPGRAGDGIHGRLDGWGGHHHGADHGGTGAVCGAVEGAQKGGIGTCQAGGDGDARRNLRRGSACDTDEIETHRFASSERASERTRVW